MLVGDEPGGAAGVGFEDDRAIAHRLRGVDEHAAELAATEDTERGPGAMYALPGASASAPSRRLAPAPSRGAAAAVPPRCHFRSAPIARAASVWRARYASRRARSAASPAASIAIAKSAAFAAPAAPMAKVATGMPLGICTIE